MNDSESLRRPLAAATQATTLWLGTGGASNAFGQVTSASVPVLESFLLELEHCAHWHWHWHWHWYWHWRWHCQWHLKDQSPY
jgi:hypothetical protein